MLAITSIKEKGTKNSWDSNTQLILACEYLSFINEDEGFDEFLSDREEEEKSFTE